MPHKRWFWLPTRAVSASAISSPNDSSRPVKLYGTAADAAGVKRARFGIPLKAVYAAGLLGDIASKVLRRDVPLSTLMVRLMHIMPPMDHRKASGELGWQPEPIQDSVRKAVMFYRERAGQARLTTSSLRQ